MDWANETAVGLNANHRSMCRFSNIEEKKYEIVSSILSEMARKEMARREMARKQKAREKIVAASRERGKLQK